MFNLHVYALEMLRKGCLAGRQLSERKLPTIEFGTEEAPMSQPGSAHMTRYLASINMINYCRFSLAIALNVSYG